MGFGEIIPGYWVLALKLLERKFNEKWPYLPDQESQLTMAKRSGNSRREDSSARLFGELKIRLELNFHSNFLGIDYLAITIIYSLNG